MARKRKTERPYNFSTKRVIEALKRTKWEYRLEIFNLVNQGWTYAAVSKYLTDKGDKVTRAGVYDVYRKVRNMSVDELQTAVMKQRNGEV